MEMPASIRQASQMDMTITPEDHIWARRRRSERVANEPHKNWRPFFCIWMPHEMSIEAWTPRRSSEVTTMRRRMQFSLYDYTNCSLVKLYTIMYLLVGNLRKIRAYIFQHSFACLQLISYTCLYITV
jgi:hypothetical protein